MINLEQYASAHGKYPNRLKDPEFTLEVMDNAQKLLDKVNAFLVEIGVKDVKVSSGFRPSAVNAATPGAAKKSAHLSGLAIDIEDPDGKLDELVVSKPDLLRKYGLFVEDPKSTPKWCHIDCVDRTDRPSRQFSV